MSLSLSSFWSGLERFLIVSSKKGASFKLTKLESFPNWTVPSVRNDLKDQGLRTTACQTARFLATMTVAQNLLHAWVWFMGWFKPLWIKFCRWLIGMPAWVPAASEQVHKVVVIGDGLAMGIGDRVILGSSGGIASRMQDEAATVRPGKKRPRTPRRQRK